MVAVAAAVVAMALAFLLLVSKNEDAKMRDEWRLRNHKTTGLNVRWNNNTLCHFKITRRSFDASKAPSALAI